MNLRPPSGDGKSPWGPVGELTPLAMTLAICVVLGLLGGRWIGRKLGSEDAGTLAGVAFGVAAAGYELRRVVRRLERYSRPTQPSDRRDEGEADDG